MRRQRILSKMKRLEMIVESHRIDETVKLIEKHATGYTLVPGVTGLGEHGYRSKEMVLLVTVVTDDHLEAIVNTILPTLGERAQIVLITDVTVLRAEHFIPEVRAAASRSKV